jgi:hypothetical protein
MERRNGGVIIPALALLVPPMIAQAPEYPLISLKLVVRG